MHEVLLIAGGGMATVMIRKRGRMVLKRDVVGSEPGPDATVEQGLDRAPSRAKDASP